LGLAAIVVCGLDTATWDALRAQMMKWHREITVAEAHDRMQPWAELAAQNRKRALGTLLRVTNVEPADSNAWREIVDAEYETRATTYAESCDWFPAHMRVPDWFVIPSRVPKHCSPCDADPGTGVRASSQRRETRPFEIKPDFDVCMDDVCSFRENEYVRMAGCASTKRAYTAVVYGPSDDLFITKHAEPKSSPDTFDTVPAQATQNVDAIASVIARDRDHDHIFWEDPELATNRMLESVYDFRGGKMPIDEDDRNVVGMTPLWIRASCRDSTNRAEPESALRRRRLAALALDDYVPISR
jgi:hypothetical protein